MMGGDVTVHSEPGEGSTFVISLPLVAQTGNHSGADPETHEVREVRGGRPAPSW